MLNMEHPFCNEMSAMTAATRAIIKRSCFMLASYASRHAAANPNFCHNKRSMNLKLFVDIDNRKLVRNKTSDSPVNLATLFCEDRIDLEITLLEPTAPSSAR